MDARDVARRWYHAASTCPADLETVLSLLAEDVVWTEAAGSAWGGTYNGRDDVAGRLLPRLYEAIDKPFFLLEDLIVDDTSIAAFGWLGGNRKGTEEAISVRFAHRLEIGHGQISTIEELLDTSLLAT
jgi:ketosteroid isomerase-like protein